jgi:hypothetical protein
MDALTLFQVATAVCGGLWTISEALAAIPSIKANSVFQAISRVLKSLAGK